MILLFPKILYNVPLLGCPWLLQVSPHPQSAAFPLLCFWPSDLWLVESPWWLSACADIEEIYPVVGYILHHPHRLLHGSPLQKHNNISYVHTCIQYIHTHIHTYIHTYIHTHTRARAHTHIHVHTHVHAHPPTQTHTCYCWSQFFTPLMHMYLHMFGFRKSIICCYIWLLGKNN